MHDRSPRRRREKRLEKILEKIIAETFPNIGKGIVNQVQEAQKVSGRINPRRNMLRHIVIKQTEIKNKYKMLRAIGKNNQ